MPDRRAPERAVPDRAISQRAAPQRIAFILKGYPRLSETFIAQEIAALERAGLEISILSLRHPTDRRTHPVHDRIRAPVRYLPEYLYQEPWRVIRAWWRMRRRPAYRAARRLWLKDWRRDPTPNRGRRFGQALVLAAELDPAVTWLHAHFVHTPGSVARYGAILSGLPFSLSAHAKDIWTTPDWEKREKLADCRWLVTCTRAGYEHLSALAPAGKVALVYHGLDLERFPPPAAASGNGSDGSDPRDPVRLLSVGRLVPKKGYDDLLRALSLLPPELHWRFHHIGGGPEGTKLKRLAERLGLAERITWSGSQTQETVLGALRAADLFLLASRIAADGDRDGLPNVLMEAQSQGLPCLATDAAGIPELIEDGRTGRLTPPGDPAAFAAALAELIAAPGHRLALGRAGTERLRRHFTLAPGIAELAARFGLVPAEPSAPAEAEDLRHEAPGL